MDLQEFVSTSLIQLVDGITEAQKVCDSKSADAYINPTRQTLSVATGMLNEAVPSLTDIKFDVAVVASEQAGKAGSAGLRVVGIGLGGQVQSAASFQSTSRIQFSVPVRLPGHSSTT